MLAGELAVVVSEGTGGVMFAVFSESKFAFPQSHFFPLFLFLCNISEKCQFQGTQTRTWAGA